MKKVLLFGLIIVLLACAQVVYAAPFNGHADYEIDSKGYYYAISAGQFPNGQTVNGTNGAMYYILDDPNWGSYPIQQWNRDGWFPQTAGLALTMKYQGNIVFDNNGIETHNTGGFYYDVPGGDADPGLYIAYCMSNNFDWIYSGYFKLNEATTVDTLIGYFAYGSYGFTNPDDPFIQYRMNIWSKTDSGGYPIPAVASFTGDVFSSDNASGTFSNSFTGEYRYSTDFYPDPYTKDIYRLVLQLDSPITLEAGEYYFGHDATVPLPGTLLLLGSGLTGLVVWRRRKAAIRR